MSLGGGASLLSTIALLCSLSFIVRYTVLCMAGSGGGGVEFHQLRRQSPAVRLGLDLPDYIPPRLKRRPSSPWLRPVRTRPASDYIPLPSTELRPTMSWCDVLSTTSAQNVDETPAQDTELLDRSTALMAEIVRQLKSIVDGRLHPGAVQPTTSACRSSSSNRVWFESMQWSRLLRYPVADEIYS